MTRETLSGAFLAVATALLLGPSVVASSFSADELNLLYNGARLTQGETLYRTFFDFLPPGVYWLAGALFTFTGPSVTAARALQTLGLGLSVGLLWLLGRRLGAGPWSATLPGLIFVACLVTRFPYWSQHWLVWPFVLGALLSATDALADPGARRWVLPGFLAGSACLITQAEGGVIAVALVLGLGLGTWLARLNLATGLRRLAGLALGLALPLGLAAACLASQGALEAAWQDVVVWPLTHYKQPGGFNDVPYGTGLAAHISPYTADWVNLPAWYARLYYYVVLWSLLPLTALFAFAWGLGLLATRRADSQTLSFGLVALTTLGMAVAAVKGRADVVHASTFAAPAGLLVSVLAARLARLGGPVAQLPRLALVAFVLAGTLLYGLTMRQHPERWLRGETADVRLRESPVVRYLHARAAPGDRIVSVPTGGMHYMHGLPSATRLNLLLPAALRYNGAEDYAAVRADIRTRRPRFVLVTPDLGTEAAVAEYGLHPLSGYRLATVADSPLAYGTAKTYLYEREAP